MDSQGNIQTCRYCKQEFTSIQELENHYMNHYRKTIIKRHRRHCGGSLTNRENNVFENTHTIGEVNSKIGNVQREAEYNENKTEESENGIAKHAVEMCTEERPYQCKFCSKKFTPCRHLKEHERVHKKQHRRHCGGSLTNRENNVFENTHTIGEVNSKIGNVQREAEYNENKTEESENGIAKHAVEMCTEERPYQCKFCSKKFTPCRHLKEHERVHKKQHRRHCGGSLTNRENNVFENTDTIVEVNSKIGNVQREAEYNENKTEESENGIAKHAVEMCTEERPYQCKFCSKKFTPCRHLKEHERVHKKQHRRHCGGSLTNRENNVFENTDTIVEVNSKIGNVQREAEYNENKTEESENGIAKHAVEMCTEERPYQCKFCSKKFTPCRHLKEHERVHKKQHRRHCGGSLTNRENNVFENTDTIVEVNSKIGNVQREAEYNENKTEESENGIAKHAVEMCTEERPYQCKFCSKKFTPCRHLKEHERVHKKQHQWHSGDSLNNRENNVLENTDTIGEVNSRIGNVQKEAEYNENNTEESENGIAREDCRNIVEMCTEEKKFQCKLCSKKFTQKGHLKDHERVHTGERSFQCKLCSKKFTLNTNLKRHEFTSIQELENHYKKQHRWHCGGSLTNRENNVFENTDTIGEVNSKIGNVQREAEYVPLIERLYNLSCSGKMETKSWANDLRRVRIRRPDYTLNSLEEEFRESITYTAPINIGINLPLSENKKVSTGFEGKCVDGEKNEKEFDDAGKVELNKTMPMRVLYGECFKNNENMKERPVLIWNKNGDIFKCYDCMKGFAKKIDLINHLIVHYNGIYNVNTNEESENGIAREDCRKHVLEMSPEERPFQSKLCSKKFTQRGHLKEQERVHAGERPFQCKLCSKKFATNGNLKKHERVHKGERPFQCKLCSKKFTLNQHLKRHERGHKGERPFQCKLCSKKFTQSGHLKEHERVHTGERPFQCKLCSKKFTTNGQLKEHENVHTGERRFQCKFCSKKFTTNRILNIHKRLHTGVRLFQCKLCSKKFTKSGQLKEHERVHTGERPFQCKLCSKKFTTNGNLKKHERVHTEERPFKCRLCSKKFSINGNLKVHERVHTGERPFQCKVCSKKFTSSGDLKIHERVHTGERPFQCKLCSKKFTQRGHLKEHERVHTGERPFQCKLCSKKFSTNRNLELHERVHTGERPFQCKMCSKKFSTNRNLELHERVHTGERPFQCKFCSKKFTRSGHLNDHERVHTGERPYQCNFCSKKFTQSGDLKTHERFHTGEGRFQCKLCSKKFTTNGILNMHKRLHAGERPFQCKLCSKNFTRNGKLKEHERVHTGERPFQCKLCSKKFTRSGDLKIHERVHTGERPFQCKLCSKKFTKSGQLKEHERVHTGERPFQCKLCPKKFRKNGSLKVHERNHTGERPFQCILCSKKFRTNGCLKSHERVHTGERPFQCKLCSKKFTFNQHLKRHERGHMGDKPFQCKLCSKKFTANGSLKLHERLHTGERPFQCKLCSKNFTRSGDLKIHERVHTGERPFQCKLCSKKFTKSGQLKEHERVHTGDRPFQCKLCSKKFTTIGSLNIHERVHTGERPFQCKLCSKKFNKNGNLKRHESVHMGEK